MLQLIHPFPHIRDNLPRRISFRVIQRAPLPGCSHFDVDGLQERIRQVERTHRSASLHGECATSLLRGLSSAWVGVCVVASVEVTCMGIDHRVCTIPMVVTVCLFVCCVV